MNTYRQLLPDAKKLVAHGFGSGQLSIKSEPVSAFINPNRVQGVVENARFVAPGTDAATLREILTALPPGGAIHMPKKCRTRLASLASKMTMEGFKTFVVHAIPQDLIQIKRLQ